MNDEFVKSFKEKYQFTKKKFKELLSRYKSDSNSYIIDKSLNIIFIKNLNSISLDEKYIDPLERYEKKIVDINKISDNDSKKLLIFQQKQILESYASNEDLKIKYNQVENLYKEKKIKKSRKTFGYKEKLKFHTLKYRKEFKIVERQRKFLNLMILNLIEEEEEDGEKIVLLFLLNRRLKRKLEKYPDFISKNLFTNIYKEGGKLKETLELFQVLIITIIINPVVMMIYY